MGIEFYVVFDNQEIETVLLWTQLYSDKDGLGLIQEAQRQDVLPLHYLTSSSVKARLEHSKAYDYTLSPEDLARPEAWFEPAEGLRTTRVLLSYLRAKPPQDEKTDYIVQWCLHFLEELEKALLTAQEKGYRFHLALNG